MKHITNEQYAKIRKAAIALADLENGCRNQQEKRESTIIELCRINRFGKECKKLPKTYKIIYTANENLGTKKWSHYIKQTHEFEINENETVKETEKSLIITYCGTYRKIINKQNILCFVW